MKRFPLALTQCTFTTSVKEVTDYTEDNSPFKIILQIIVLHFSKAIL